MTKIYATRAFKDAGTEREFAAGAEITGVEAGHLDNYLAAGLVSAESGGTGTLASDAAADKPTPAKRTRSKAASKPH